MQSQDFGAKTVACAAERMRANSTSEYASERRVFIAIDRAVGLPDTVAALQRQGFQAALQGEADALEQRSNEKQFLSGCAAPAPNIFALDPHGMKTECDSVDAGTSTCC